MPTTAHRPRPIPRLARLLLGAGLVLLLASPGPSQETAVPPLTRPLLPNVVARPDPARASVLFASAVEAERRGVPGCVDLYYRAAVAAYAALFDSPPAEEGDTPARLDAHALRLYNDSLDACLRAATDNGRLDPDNGLLVQTDAGAITVPVVIQGDIWRRDDLSALVDPSIVALDPELERRHTRLGLGTPQVAVRHARGDADDAFLGRRHPFPMTAVLYPDLDAWLGPPAEEEGDESAEAVAPRDRLLLADPIRVRSVAVPGGAVPLAADLDAPIALLRQQIGGERYMILNLLDPGKTLRFANLYLLEPYQPGKIPVVLVHGLASSPLTWCDLIGDLRADPEFCRRFQIFVFAYPTGVSFLRSGQLLRDSLRRVQATFDPTGTDPALSNVVVVGHSMGGLVSKLQVIESGTAFWDSHARIPFGQMTITPEGRRLLAPIVFFEPSPAVRRVIFIATPHRGSNMAKAFLGRLGRHLIRPPDDSRELFLQVYRDNPHAFVEGFRRLPTSIDLLEPDNPLLQALITCPVAPGVVQHSIIGVAKADPLRGTSGDGVVPVTSARIGEVASEVFVDATHTHIHHHPETIVEVRRILDLHLAEAGGPSTATVPTPLATSPPGDSSIRPAGADRR